MKLLEESNCNGTLDHNSITRQPFSSSRKNYSGRTPKVPKAAIATVNFFSQTTHASLSSPWQHDDVALYNPDSSMALHA